MKTFLIILDGVGDRNSKEIKKKTPLEAASTPNLDFFSENGKLGYMYSIKENYVPESDNAITSILGNDLFVAARGQLEAIGAEIRTEHGDLALRTNFGTITNLKDGKIIDRRAGRTLSTKEALILAKAINKGVKLPCKFIFKPTVQHRGVLAFRGGFSDNITNTDPSYRVKGKFSLKDELRYSEPLDEEESSKLSANILNSFTEQSYLILNNHPINQLRIKNNLLPANIILSRDPGTEIPQLKKLIGNWAAVVSMPLEIGIAKLTGMQVFSFSYPQLENPDIYHNLYLGLSTSINFAKNIINRIFNKFDKFYIHFKETDVPGHDNKPEEKRKMIEMIDKDFLSFLKTLNEKEKIKIIITADHATPCSLKSHSSDPVPFLIFGEGKDNKEKAKRFTEKDSLRGSLGKIYGKDVLKFVY